MPELEIVTQARHWGEAETMARDLIACQLDVPMETIVVQLEKSPELPGPAASPWMHVKVWVDVVWERVIRRQP
ncbi:hypothetical protein ACQEVB_11770 [Pseudonocardia sp. CA-107938]|uniref:hypothetical protein n=1 Tax=Pseudonocardia sp. CA-107938 TaxID=3240021 RepID=UPI003D916325